ncbi:uncharacterized protein LOC141803338 [Halichoeres trimaculatus]|uniref:uncharacterized protein LOC141803338 n=1 Tax=Halichoeres trimaculatus TaxID=147232 RepID=UPI003D9FA7C1
MLPPGLWMHTTPRQFLGAYSPFPRSIWINSLEPFDDFDRVCQIIWERSKEVEETLNRGQIPPGRAIKDCKTEDIKPSPRTEEQQKKTDDLGPCTQSEKDKRQNATDFTLPNPYLSDHRHVAKPSRTLSLVMEEQMKHREEEAEGQTKLTGHQPCPTEPSASGKLQGQLEIPPSFCPNDIPTATLANGMTAHAQAGVQSKAEAPQANTKTNVPAAIPAQQEAYDLLADFPPLGPPLRPLAMGEAHNRHPKAEKAKGKRGITHLPNHHQESGASHQRKTKNVPREESPICAGDQKSVLDLQTFGAADQRNSPTISCKAKKSNNQAIPKVAGTDGVGGNARSWASTAKVGMKQAAAPQEKARPCAFQQIVTINRAKANNATPSHHAAHPLKTANAHARQPRNPNQRVSPGQPYVSQHFGAQVHGANCPPGSRRHFPLLQAGGNLSKPSHVCSAATVTK